jgi:tRNA(fMet)-specific endonuclease VapC
VPRADLAFCIVSFHEQVLGCNSYIAQAKTSADLVPGYRMFDRVLSAIAASRVLPFDISASNVVDGLAAQ